MKKLQILGTGCANCRRLLANVELAAAACGGQYTIEKVTDLAEIMKFGVMVTPALAVDGVVKSVGRALDVAAIRQLIA
jgi:small redox-active disulfide protein 2